jgi:hypothetical protein
VSIDRQRTSVFENILPPFFGGFHMSNRCARLFTHVQLPLMLVVAALLVVALPAYAGDTGEEAFEDLDDAASPTYTGDNPCGEAEEVHRGDRMLRVWACGYTNTSGISERGRVVMVTYRWSERINGWIAVTSKSITLHHAYLEDRTTGIRVFGQNWGRDTCRHGSPGSPIGCSVPNTHKVTFYGPAWNRPAGQGKA